VPPSPQAAKSATPDTPSKAPPARNPIPATFPANPAKVPVKSQNCSCRPYSQ
jgi:hypothetical protein